jgi:hypothetical protein
VVRDALNGNPKALQICRDSIDHCVFGFERAGYADKLLQQFAPAQLAGTNKFLQHTI